MTSILAKETLAKWKREGLEPTLDDIILINNLGLAVERGSDMYNFSACPRHAFLGDNIFREPTVAKRIWIDQVQSALANTVESRVYVMAYALGTADDELPPINDIKKVRKAIMKFRDGILMHFTDTQILAVIDYCLNGNKPVIDIPEDASEAEKKQKKDVEEVIRVPGEYHSLAKQLLLEAISSKIPPEAAKYALLDDLERMILVAAMHDGAKITQNEQMKASGNFYVASGRIYGRLLKEKEENEVKDGEK